MPDRFSPSAEDRTEAINWMTKHAPVSDVVDGQAHNALATLIGTNRERDTKLCPEHAGRMEKCGCVLITKGVANLGGDEIEQVVAATVIDAAVQAERLQRQDVERELLAFKGALEEWGRWPDLPGVEYGATIDGKKVILRAYEIEGLSHAIMEHAKNAIPWATVMYEKVQDMESLAANLAHAQDDAAELRKITLKLERENTALRDKLEARSGIEAR